MAEESKLLISSWAKGIKAAWAKTLLVGNNHLLGITAYDGVGNGIQSYNGFIDDDLYASQVSRGNVVGAEPLFGYGESLSTGLVTNRPLAPFGLGDTINVPPAAGVQMSLVSTSANDDKDAGTGARSIYIRYLDVNLEQQVEEVFLEGLTPVLTTATDIRFIQSPHVKTFGSVGAADGNISIYTAGPVIYSYITAGTKRCESSFRRVPANKRLMIKSLHAGAVSGTSAARCIVRVVTTKVDNIDYTESGYFLPVMSLAFQDNSVAFSNDMPLPVDPGVIIGMVYDSDKAANVTGGYTGYFEDI